MLARKLLLVDVETTGLDPLTDSIVQIAACILSRQELNEEGTFNTLVRPESAMSPSARKIHGLSDSHLESAPRLVEALGRFADFAPPDAILCGHNVSFDVNFLTAAYRKCEMLFPFDYHTVDIWSVAFFILGAEGISLPSFNLNALCGLYGIERSPKHDALEDVRASASVLKYLYSAVRDKALGATGQIDLFHTR